MLFRRFWFLSILGCLFTNGMSGQTLYLSAKGTTSNETSSIDSLNYQRTFENYISLEKETVNIRKSLVSQGFIETELIGLKKENDSIYVAYYELNERFKSIRLYFDESIDRNILKLISQDIQDNYIDIEISKLESSLKLLNTEISNLGDPFSSLQLNNISKMDDGRLQADLMVSEQLGKRTIDSIIVKGYEKFPKSYVKHFLKLKAKQPFNLKTIKDKTAELENLVFANQIKEPEVLFTKDSTLLYIYVEKQKSNAFDGFLGFGTNTETNKIEFNGYLDLNLVNNLNYGESFQLSYKSDESQQKIFDVSAKLPYLFGSPIGINLGLNIFKKDSTFLTVSQSAKLDYQINSQHLVGAGINAVTSTNLLDNNPTFVNDYNSIFYILYYTHMKRQRFDRLFPINFLFDLSGGFGQRTFQSTKESQTRFEINAFKIFNLNLKNSVYIRINGATLFSSNYFDNELFRFGGITSIRGFNENSLSANLFSILNTEYRYKVSNALYIHSVFDAAYFENNIQDLKGKLFGFGFGFGLLTKAGLFKLNYAGGKSENNPFKFADSKVHLSLTASF